MSNAKYSPGRCAEVLETHLSSSSSIDCSLTFEDDENDLAYVALECPRGVRNLRNIAVPLAHRLLAVQRRWRLGHIADLRTDRARERSFVHAHIK